MQVAFPGAAHRAPLDEELERKLGKQWLAVLGSQERARHWLTQCNNGLGGETPESALNADEGLERVLAMLERTDGGIIA